jgi:hypothetical protein
MAERAHRLLRYGVTAGVAATLYFRVWDPSIENVAGGALPFVGLLPAFWTTNTARNAYCAAQWSAPEEEARAAAQMEQESTQSEGIRVALQRQEERRRLVRAWQSRLHDALLKAKCAKDSDADLADLGRAQLQCNQDTGENESVWRRSCTLANGGAAVEQVVPLAGCPPAAKADDSVSGLVKGLWEALRLEAEADLEVDRVQGEHVASHDWACEPYKFGLFIGYPATFTATTTIERRTVANEAKREVTPVLAFGIAILPNAAVSILAGIAVGTAPRDDGTAAAIWSGLVGAGVNLDVVNLIR